MISIPAARELPLGGAPCSHSTAFSDSGISLRVFVLLIAARTVTSFSLRFKYSATAAKETFSKRADAFFTKHTKQSSIENSRNETYAEGVLSELADHHEAIGKAAIQLALEPKTLNPPFINFKKLQLFLRDKEPDVAQALRNRYIAVGLPTYGLEDGPPQNLEWRWFILGCVLLLFGVALVIWGFSRIRQSNPPSRAGVFDATST